MPYPLRRPSYGVLLGVAVAAVGLAAQERAPGPQEPPEPRTFRTDATYIRVDVFPTRDGRPVSGLRAEDFELLEDGVRQELRAFEHVVIAPAGPQALRAEAASFRGGAEMAANPRSRVFVFFLDVPHVAIEGGLHITEPLIRLMDRILGPEDVVAVMTPHMSARQITFGRKTAVVSEMLRDEWAWGRRHSLVDMDGREQQYRRCFPPVSVDEGSVPPIVRAMVERRRERMVLDALHDLVTYLGGIREERKAILAITEGWVLYRPDASMTRVRTDPQTGVSERLPGIPPVGVDGSGTLRVDPPARGPDEASVTECDRDRMHLAAIDNEDYFRQLLDRANRYNASFYPMDPRGLAAVDAPTGPLPPPTLHEDQARLGRRLEALRTLADATDGMALVNSNDLNRGLDRIADDLTSYYLLGYYSTNARLDGGYRRIRVHVRQPGIDVRARRGYRAATAEDVRSARAAAAAPADAHIRATAASLGMLARLRDDQRLAIRAVPLHGVAAATPPAIRVVGELRGPQRDLQGGDVTVEVTGGSGGSSVRLQPGTRTFVMDIPVERTGGAVDVRARIAGPDGETLMDGVRVDPGAIPAVLLFRRGPSTGNRYQPAADLRFTRMERLRLELPLPDGGADAAGGRLLDRNAQPLPVPLEASQRSDAHGRWLVVDASLSALGAGDYVVEVGYVLNGTEHRVQTPVRVTR